MLSFLIRLCASASAVNPGFPILRDPETVIKNRTDRPFLRLLLFSVFQRFSRFGNPGEEQIEHYLLDSAPASPR